VFIGTLSYLFTKTPPKTIRPRPNVIVMIAPIQNCLSHPSETCDWAHVRIFRDNLAGWSKLTDRLYIWDYIICFHHLYLPFPNLDALQPNVKFYAKHGIRGIFEQGDTGGEIKELRNYLLAKCMWNPDTDASAVREEFLEGYYGPAAGPIGEYLEMTHRKVRDENIHMYIWAKPDSHITPEILSRARELFDEAERRVAGQPELIERVEMARLAIQYAELCRPSPFVKSAPIYARFKAVVERENLESYGEGKAMDGWLAEKGAMCAQIEFDAGDHARGIYGFESALSISPKNLSVLRQLAEHRRKVFPDLLTYGSVDAHLAREVIVPGDAVWRYFPGTEAPSPGLEWAQDDFDDQAWLEGKSGFGYGDGDDATVLKDMQNKYTTLYIRRAFDVADPSAYEKVTLSVSVDDGFIAYLNGVEVGRSNVPEVSPGNDGLANLSAREPLVPINVELSLRKGRNILALHGLNRDLESSDFSLAPAVKARSRPDPKRGRPLLEKYLAAVPEPTRSVAAYFEGRVLASEGKHAEAVKKFRLVRELDRTHREPLERLLESLRASGQTAEAERLQKED
jgi:tetratricopeptide (TPR) repeat protein